MQAPWAVAHPDRVLHDFYFWREELEAWHIALRPSGPDPVWEMAGYGASPYIDRGMSWSGG